MSGLEALRRLKRDPAQFAAEVDPAGHTFSPSIKKQQKEIATKLEETEELATKAKAEFEQRYAEGFARREGGDVDGALEHFAAAYILAREMNYRAGEADALNMTGVCYKCRGELERAAGVFEGCAQLCARLKDSQGEAAALGNLGQALAAQRRLAEAEAAHERSLELARGGVADKSGELSALFHLGTLRLRLQKFAEAEASLALAQTIAVSLGDVAAEVGVLQRLAAARELHQQQQRQHEQQQPPPPPSQQQLRHMGVGAGGALRAPVGRAAGAAGAPPPRASRFVLEPAAQLSASLPLRLPSQQLQTSAPLPPLEPAPLTPLELLVRAQTLTNQLDASSPLRLQVLRQLRAQYAKGDDRDGMRSCEAQIDALHTMAEAERVAAGAAQLTLAAAEPDGGAKGSGGGSSEGAVEAPGTLV